MSTQRGSTTFKPRARIIKLLGEELITNEVIATVELVKNSYDADATKVEVTLENVTDVANGRILIKDNGIGMSLDTVLNDWLQPGTEVKKKILGIAKRLVEDVLGIKMERRKPETDKLVENLMNLIIDIRRQMREREDWKTADEIRAKLRALGLVLEDTLEGTTWKIKRKP